MFERLGCEVYKGNKEQMESYLSLGTVFGTYTLVLRQFLEHLKISSEDPNFWSEKKEPIYR